MRIIASTGEHRNVRRGDNRADLGGPAWTKETRRHVRLSETFLNRAYCQEVCEGDAGLRRCEGAKPGGVIRKHDRVAAE